MKSNRDICIAETLKWEGGYSNDAADPGGPTNWGITIIDARKYWKKDATASDVKKMPKSVAYNIYASKYWKTPYYDCDTLPSGVDLATYDFGVNSGPSRAKRYLVAASGGTAEETITKLCDSRLAFLKGLSTWPSFGKGWGRRVAGIKAKSLAMSKTGVTGTDVATGTGATAGTAAATYTYWDWIVAHPKTSTLIVVGIAALVGAVIWAFKK